jgi:hypothetical protein
MSLIGLIFIFKSWIGSSLSFGLSFVLSILEILVAFLHQLDKKVTDNILRKAIFTNKSTLNNFLSKNLACRYSDMKPKPFFFVLKNEWLVGRAKSWLAKFCRNKQKPILRRRKSIVKI